MTTTPTTELLPAQYDEGILIAHPAAVLKFLGVDVMVQRSCIDSKVLVTIDGDDRDTRIDLNDGTVWNGPGEPTHLSPAAEAAAENWNSGRRTFQLKLQVTVNAHEVPEDYTVHNLRDDISDGVFAAVTEGESPLHPVILTLETMEDL